MEIKRLVNNICLQYKTRDPFDLAELMDIMIIHEPLGKIQGYFHEYQGFRFIHINNSLSEAEACFTCCHELGHAIQHAELHTPFLKNNTLFSLNKYEQQANKFAVHLMFSDSELQVFLDQPITNAAQNMSIPIELAEYRMNLVSTVSSYSI